jgi:hypothetical protein
MITGREASAAGALDRLTPATVAGVNPRIGCLSADADQL